MVRWWRGRDDVLRTAAAAMWRRNAVGGYHTIDAVPREHSGHRAASRERGFGRIPAVVTTTGKGSPVSRKQLITFDKDQIDSLLRDSAFFTSTIFDLQILAGVGSTVVLQSGNVHKSVETGQVLNMVVAWVDESSELKVDVPVVFNGEDNCLGLKKGVSSVSTGAWQILSLPAQNPLPALTRLFFPDPSQAASFSGDSSSGDRSFSLPTSPAILSPRTSLS
ncbi:hypothetical protein KSP39_PZI009238 [Platanthera zijinensis]|uniref:Large ribosomal subunit protein bL25 L25 domain-containing protein n=1 Tax=Platanthera zijinensis TaxID=2320716 RepID=A0AAP0BMB4_9ASPA